MGKFIDITGMSFNRWTVLSRAETRIGGDIAWLCRCSCGTERVVRGYTLKGGTSKSCGCWNYEVTVARNIAKAKHGYSRTGRGNRTWVSWNNMVNRCKPKYAEKWPYYAGRGIKVCDRWLGESGFINFLADMGERPKGKTLDRIDVNGNYGPDNCRWATALEQTHNRRTKGVRSFADSEIRDEFRKRDMAWL